MTFLGVCAGTRKATQQGSGSGIVLVFGGAGDDLNLLLIDLLIGGLLLLLVDLLLVGGVGAVKR
ncbi:hypothetical protein CRG98_050455 [Punica granatum]|uniref:Uncharacterized protein n=1 Tax=Punica granatum TaxID=22663 RepID=A0A2I0GBH9_PUNGR|nr:hypothetical protein CRG98_050455 [Punica granatum]